MLCTASSKSGKPLVFSTTWTSGFCRCSDQVRQSSIEHHRDKAPLANSVQGCNSGFLFQCFSPSLEPYIQNQDIKPARLQRLEGSAEIRQDFDLHTILGIGE